MKRILLAVALFLAPFVASAQSPIVNAGECKALDLVGCVNLGMSRVGSGTITVGTTPISGGANGFFLKDNNGVIGEASGTSTIALPQALTGATSGGVACYTSTTTMSTSALLASGSIMVGGGAGTCPSTVTIAGDCTFSSPNLTCTKLSGVSPGTLYSQNSVLASQLPAPTGSALGGVKSSTAATHNFMTGIDTSGTPLFAQPAFTDISGAVASTQLPTPTLSTLGGVMSATAIAANFMTGIDTTGAPLFAQPAIAGIAGAGALASLDVVPVPPVAFTGTTDQIQTTNQGNLITLCNSSGDTASLPAAATVGVNWAVTVENICRADSFVAPAGTDQINGVNKNVTLGQFDSATFVSNATSWTAVVSPGRHMNRMHPGYTAPSLYFTLPGVPIVAGSAVAANVVYCSPALIQDWNVTLIGLAVNVTTGAAGGHISLAVYNNNPSTHRPGTLIRGQAFTISSAGTGLLNNSITSTQFAPGFYWTCAQADNATNVMNSLPIDGSIASYVGVNGSNVLNTTGNLAGVSTPLTFGTWPDLSAATWSNVTTTVNPAIAINITTSP
jgi:hypothetical protein